MSGLKRKTHTRQSAYERRMGRMASNRTIPYQRTGGHHPTPVKRKKPPSPGWLKRLLRRLRAWARSWKKAPVPAHP